MITKHVCSAEMSSGYGQFTRQFGGQVDVAVFFGEMHFALGRAPQAPVGEHGDGRGQAAVLLLPDVLLDEQQVADNHVLRL